MRRSVCVLLTVLCLLAAPGSPVSAAEVKIDESTKKAVEKGLQWLATKQNADGSWSESRYPHNTAITAFALLAFMSEGHLPNQGLYGPEVAKGCRFLLSAAREDGYLVGLSGNMYSHAMATLALAELWGMTGDKEIKSVLEKAVKLIVGSQNHEGGWRYDPRPTGADISVTIMQVMALRAAKNSGLNVPAETLKNALAYINRCYKPEKGGFTYQVNSGEPGFARTAAGVCVLQLVGEYKAAQIPKAVEYLKDPKHFNSREHFWYGQYYAAHAMHQVGGKDWEDWYDRVRKLILPMQGADGSWLGHDNAGVGPVYATSIAVIILSTPADYLPIFQR